MSEQLVNMVLEYQRYMEPYDRDLTPEEEVQQTRDMLEHDLSRFVFNLRETMNECDPTDEVYVMTKMVLDAIIHELGSTYDVHFPVTIYATVKIEAATQADAMSIARGLWYNDDFLRKYVVPQYEIDKTTLSVDEPFTYEASGMPDISTNEVNRYL